MARAVPPHTTPTPRREDAFERGAAPSTAALLAASRVRRSDGPEGVEPILTAHESGRVQRLFGARPDVRAAVEALSAGLSEVKEAILLRAVSARSDA